MGTLGPTGTTADVTTFANFKSWAGTGTFGINSAFTNFGWTRTADLNQINWAASPNAPPLAGSGYPIGTALGLTATLDSASVASVAGAEHQIYSSVQNNISLGMGNNTTDQWYIVAALFGSNTNTPVLVNYAQGGSGTGTVQTSVSSAAQSLTGGNMVVVGHRWAGVAVNDTAGNTYIPLPFQPGNTTFTPSEGWQFWYVPAAIGNAANVVTVTLDGGNNTFTAIEVWQISGGPFAFDFQTKGSSSFITGTVYNTSFFSTSFTHEIALVSGTNVATTSTYSAGSGSTTASQPGATFNGVFTKGYAVNCRGTWVPGTAYNYLDVVTSPVTGASYINNRNFIVSNVSVTGPLATCTAANNLNVGGGDKVRFSLSVSDAFWLLGQTFTVVNATSTAFVINVSEVIGSTSNFSQGEAGGVGVQVTSNVDPSLDATNWTVYHYEIWQSNDAVSYPVTNVARTAGGLATFTCANNILKAGFNVAVAGLTNVPSLNGTWCVLAATPTAFTVQTGGGLINSTADSGTATYTFMPMLMKLEYYGNTSQYSTAPWVRLSFGIGGTDGLGNLTGNLVGSNTLPFSLLGDFIFCDLRPNASGTTASGAQTSSIWQCAASGASPTGTNTIGNGGRFGVALQYSRNDTFVTNTNSIFWVVERSYGDAGYATDDYITYVVGCFGNNGVFANQQVELQQRSILKPNPAATPTSVSVVSNTAAIAYASSVGTYNFAVGATVYAANLQNARFLNGQYLLVSAASLSLTSVATTSTVADSLTKAAAAMSGQTVYTGTFSPTILPGTLVTITGFTNLPNNGTFAVVNCTATSLVVANNAGVAETHAATATYSQTVYTGAVTNGAGNFYAGLSITVAGFSGGNNDGTFLCTASSATTLTLANGAATSETHAASATGNFLIAQFTNANYGPTPDSGTLSITTSASTPTPIAGTGLVCLSDPRAACPYTTQSSLLVNGQVPLLPVFPVLGFVGNPMTEGASIKSGDQLAHDQTFAITVYGVTMHYNNLQGLNTVDPYAAFGGFNGSNVSTTNGGSNLSGFQRTNGFMLRWD